MTKILFFFLLIILYFSTYSQSLKSLIIGKKCTEVENFNYPINSAFEQGILMFTIQKSDLKMLKILIKKGGDPKQQSLLPVNFDNKFNFSFYYGSCLTTAAGENKIDIVKFLLKNGVQVDEKEAIESPDSEIFYGIKKNAGWTALQWACVRGNNEIIEYLIKKGADIDLAYISDNDDKHIDSFFDTPLLLALKFGHIESAKILIKLGADVNKFTDFCLSPLAIANKMNDKELIKLLYKKEAKLFTKHEMNVKKHILMRDDSIANKYFSKKELKTFEIFLSKIDSVILGSNPTSKKIKDVYIDSLKSKLNRNKPNGYTKLFTNHAFNLSLIKNTDYKLWKNKEYEKSKIQKIELTLKIANFFIDCITTNNNMSKYVVTARVTGNFPFFCSDEFININPLLDRERFYVSVLLFYASFPNFTSLKSIKYNNLDNSINDNFHEYQKVIELNK